MWRLRGGVSYHFTLDTGNAKIESGEPGKSARVSCTSFGYLRLDFRQTFIKRSLLPLLRIGTAEYPIMSHLVFRTTTLHLLHFDCHLSPSFPEKLRLRASCYRSLTSISMNSRISEL